MKQRMAMLSLQTLLLPVLALAQASPVLVLKTRIPLANVKGRMDHLGVDLKGKRLFATAFDNHTVEVIDLQAGGKHTRLRIWTTRRERSTTLPPITCSSLARVTAP